MLLQHQAMLMVSLCHNDMHTPDPHINVIKWNHISVFVLFCMLSLLTANSEAMDIQSLQDQFYQNGWVVLKGCVSDLGLLSDLTATASHVADLHKKKDWNTRAPFDGLRFNLANNFNYKCSGYLSCMKDGHIVELLTALFGTDEWMYDQLGGDAVWPAAAAQQTHSDDPGCDPLHVTDKPGTRHPNEAWKDDIRPGVISCSVCISDTGVDDAPIRVWTWDEMLSTGFMPPSLEDEQSDVATYEPRKLCMSVGDVLVRDVRVWHGGSEHNGILPRVLPSIRAVHPAYLSEYWPTPRMEIASFNRFLAGTPAAKHCKWLVRCDLMAMD